MFCFERASFHSLDTAKTYLSGCFQAVRRNCLSVSPENLFYCDQVFSPFLGASVSLLILKGFQDLQERGWKSKLAWIEIGIGVSGLFMAFIQKFSFCSATLKIISSKRFPAFCMSPTTHFQNNVKNIVTNHLIDAYGDSVLQSNALIECDEGVWDPNAQRYNHLCTVSNFQGKYLREVECFPNNTLPFGWTHYVFIAFH